MSQLAIAVLAVTAALGLVAGFALRRPDMAGRPEVRQAVGLAIIVGVLLGLAIGVLGAALAGLDTEVEPGDYLAVLPYAVATGVVTFLAGLAGYWLAARVIRGRAAVLGALAGPVIFVWVYMLAASVGS